MYETWSFFCEGSTFQSRFPPQAPSLHTYKTLCKASMTLFEGPQRNGLGVPWNAQKAHFTFQHIFLGRFNKYL